VPAERRDRFVVLLMKFKIDWFLAGMVAAVALAWLFPGPGAQGGAMHPELVTKLGVALIFFLHGVSLSFAAMKAGTLQWKLHLVVQGCTFLFFPLLGLVLLKLVGNSMSPDLKLGFFYLCALPSTVSSSVAMTSAARGNVPAAVFNATLSSLLGVFLTPLWMGWMLRGVNHPVPMVSVIEDLLQWLVLPLVIGQICRPWLGNWVSRHRKGVHLADRLTILLLVYTSFCDSMKWGVWTKHGPGTVMAALVGTTLLFWIVILAVGAASDYLGLSFEDKITAVFCGSKKTLASGIPMAQLIFGSHPGISLILIPIMIYHPLQLVICGAIAGRWARRSIQSG
jgi:solute carrier family 10 (sodium/bile acid cotransporter), member 7